MNHDLAIHHSMFGIVEHLFWPHLRAIALITAENCRITGLARVQSYSDRTTTLDRTGIDKPPDVSGVALLAATDYH